jgi:hypothetical protein
MLKDSEWRVKYMETRIKNEVGEKEEAPSKLKALMKKHLEVVSAAPIN